MACKLCNRFRDRLWQRSDAWERAHSNDSELWAEESDENRKLINLALVLERTDAAAAFRLHLEAAEARSVWSTQKIGWHYQTGTGVAADSVMALEYYHRAICAGSWMATLHYARLLAEVGRYDDCVSTLEQGVASDFVPAYFWLAWFRYERSKSRKVCEEVRSLLEYAASHGHPAANFKLARWMLFGKFGPRKIFAGVVLALRGASRWARETSDEQVILNYAEPTAGRG
jgi:TPR repeat protein